MMENLLMFIMVIYGLGNERVQRSALYLMIQVFLN